IACERGGLALRFDRRLPDLPGAPRRAGACGHREPPADGYASSREGCPQVRDFSCSFHRCLMDGGYRHGVGTAEVMGCRSGGQTAMKIPKRLARFAWPAVALATVLTVVGVVPRFSFSRDGAIWSERP